MKNPGTFMAIFWLSAITLFVIGVILPEHWFNSVTVYDKVRIFFFGMPTPLFIMGWYPVFEGTTKRFAAFAFATITIALVGTAAYAILQSIFGSALSYGVALFIVLIAGICVFVRNIITKTNHQKLA